MFSIMFCVTCGTLETTFKLFFVTSNYKKYIGINVQGLSVCIRGSP